MAGSIRWICSRTRVSAVKILRLSFLEEEHFCPKSRGSQLRFPLRTPSSAKHQRRWSYFGWRRVGRIAWSGCTVLERRGGRLCGIEPAAASVGNVCRSSDTYLQDWQRRSESIKVGPVKSFLLGSVRPSEVIDLRQCEPASARSQAPSGVWRQIDPFEHECGTGNEKSPFVGEPVRLHPEIGRSSGSRLSIASYGRKLVTA